MGAAHPGTFLLVTEAGMSFPSAHRGQRGPWDHVSPGETAGGTRGVAGPEGQRSLLLLPTLLPGPARRVLTAVPAFSSWGSQSTHSKAPQTREGPRDDWGATACRHGARLRERQDAGTRIPSGHLSPVSISHRPRVADGGRKGHSGGLLCSRVLMITRSGTVASDTPGAHLE